MSPTSSGRDWPPPGAVAPPEPAAPSPAAAVQQQGPSGRERPRSANRAAFGRLVAFLVAVVLLAVFLHGLAVLVVILALIAMVMLHEAGHFLTAKVSGMKVTEYFLGFGPRLWSVRRGRDRVRGEGDPGRRLRPDRRDDQRSRRSPAEDEPRSYRQASFPRRILVAVAGSAMHFVIAFGLLWGACAFSGLPVGSTVTTQVAAVQSFAGMKSPAQAAGLRAGDSIVAVDGKKVTGARSLRHLIEASAGRTLSLTVRRKGREVTLPITPAAARDVKVEVAGGTEAFPGARPSWGVIGVDFDTVELYRTWNPLVALGHAGTTLGRITSATGTGIAQVFSFHGLGNLVHQVATAGASNGTGTSTGTGGSGGSAASGSTSSSGSGEILSTVGAAEIAVQAAHEGVSQLLLILVAINIFVGMVNLFPMLPLDGGHVVIALYERARSRRGRPYHADVAKLMPVAYLFLALILAIGLGALYVNLLHPPSLGG